jgi:hypothetical protein
MCMNDFFFSFFDVCYLFVLLVPGSWIIFFVRPQREGKEGQALQCVHVGCWYVLYGMMLGYCNSKYTYVSYIK